MSKHDKRPAFPGSFNNDGDRNVTAPDGQLVAPGGTVEMQGMTLRDYFAAKAMQGVISSPHFDANEGQLNVNQVAETAYMYADAMLEERVK